MNAYDENEIIGDIYGAALDHKLWKNVLVKICRLISADEGTFIFYDRQDRRRNSLITAYNEDNRNYVDNHLDTEVLFVRKVFPNDIEGAILTKADLVAKLKGGYEEQLGEPALVPERIPFEAKAAISLINNTNIVSVLGFHSRRGKPDLSIESIDFLKKIAPHVVQSSRIHNHITSLQTTYSGFYEVLNSVNHGVFLLGVAGEVIFSNNEAARMLDTQCGLILAKSGTLQHSDSQSNVQLKKSVNLLLKMPAETDRESSTFVLRHEQAELSLQANLFPIYHKNAQLFATSGARLALFIRDPNRPLYISENYLQQAYQLTNAEIAISKLLLDSFDVKAIASARSTSIETVRGHIKKIIKKTNTHSQAELVGLLTSLSNAM